MTCKSERNLFGVTGFRAGGKAKTKESWMTLSMVCLFTLFSCLFISAACWAQGAGGGAGVGLPIDLLMPSPPRNVTATADNGAATVTFDPPKTDGGSRVTGYTVTSHPGGLRANGSKSPITVKGLSSGKEYYFTVTASNSVGTGLASEPSNSVTPSVH
jgi:hypothetical protein